MQWAVSVGGQAEGGAWSIPKEGTVSACHGSSSNGAPATLWHCGWVGQVVRQALLASREVE